MSSSATCIHYITASHSSLLFDRRVGILQPRIKAINHLKHQIQSLRQCAYAEPSILRQPLHADTVNRHFVAHAEPDSFDSFDDKGAHLDAIAQS